MSSVDDCADGEDGYWPARTRLWLAFGGLLYLAWAINVTWPLVQGLDHLIIGGLGDQAGALANMRETIQDHQVPFLPGTLGDFSAPEGLQVSWGVNLGNWPYLLPVWLLSLVFGPVTALGLVTVAGFVLNGISMQLLVLRVTRVHGAAIVAGFAFAFYPFFVVKSGTHPQFVHAWPLALLAWRMLEVATEASRRNIALAAAASILCLGFTSYYVLIGGILLAFAMAAALVAGWRTGRLSEQVRAQAVVGGASVVYLAGLAALTLGAGSAALRSHDKQELYAYAARVHDYVLPFGRNKLFGDVTQSYLQASAQANGSNFAETTLYVGVFVLLLASLALATVVALRADRRQRAVVLAALGLSLFALAASAPPKVSIAGHLVPMPSDFISDLTTTWRVYSRFASVVMLGLVVLAGVGAAFLMRRHGALGRAVITLVLLALIAVDFTWRPGAADIGERPGVFALVAKQGHGVLAQYPLLPAGFGDSSDTFWQQAHGHPILNGYSEDGYNDRRALSLYYVDSRETARALASLGVSDVLVPDTPVPGTPDPGRPRAGFRFVGRGQYGAGTASVYRVVARPDLGTPYVSAGGITLPEGPREDRFTWLTGSEGTVVVDTPRCADPCRGTLRMSLTTLARPRVVTLRNEDGRLLWQGRVRARSNIRLPLAVTGGRATVKVEVKPGAQVISEALPGNLDPRAVSVSVGRLRFTR